MMKSMCLLATAALCGAVEYESWKTMAHLRTPAARLETYFEGSTKSVDKCLGVAEGFSSPDDFAVYYKESLELCQVFKRADLGKYDSEENVMEWNNSTLPVNATHNSTMYVKKAKTKESDDITEAGIVMTVILSIVFAAMLVACAFLCKEEDSDIAGQMDRLEKRELEMEEAASEDWERRSHAEEEKERAVAEQELKQIESMDKKQA